MAIGPLLKLQAVNEILADLGQSPVTALQATRDAISAEGALDRAVRELLEGEWWFNSDDEEYVVPTAPGWVHLPDDIVTADAWEKQVRLVERGVGRRLWDVTNRSFDLSRYGGPSNLLASPYDFSAADWTASTLTVNADSQVSPEGTTLADRLVAASGASLIYQDVAGADLTQGQEYDFGLYAAPLSSSPTDNGDAFSILLAHNGGTNNGLVTVDLTAGALTLSSGLAFKASVQPVEHGLYLVRARMVYDPATYGGSGFRYSIFPGQTDTVAAWGAWLKAADTSPVRLEVERSFSAKDSVEDTAGPFSSMPAEARTYAVAKAARYAQFQVIGDTSSDDRLRANELAAYTRLLQADDEVSDPNALRDNWDTARVVNPFRLDPLTEL